VSSDAIGNFNKIEAIFSSVERQQLSRKLKAIQESEWDERTGRESSPHLF
jgi:hypothetical protein